MTKPVSAKGVLFDLDGTLLDTAPDLVAALNLSLKDHGFASVALDDMRKVASHGSLALVRAAVPNLEDHLAFVLQQGLLEHYHRVNGDHCQLFAGVTELLHSCAEMGIPWGIVTNKAARYARPLLNKLAPELGPLGCQSLISGDSVTRGKPDPAPLRLAASQIHRHPNQIYYLGDARRDMEAARAAGMVSVLAAWGYIGDDDDVTSWPSDLTLKRASDLIGELAAS